MFVLKWLKSNNDENIEDDKQINNDENIEIDKYNSFTNHIHKIYLNIIENKDNIIKEKNDIIIFNQNIITSQNQYMELLKNRVEYLEKYISTRLEYLEKYTLDNNTETLDNNIEILDIKNEIYINHGKKWTDQDKIKLINMYLHNNSIEDMIKCFKRTPSAIKCEIRKMIYLDYITDLNRNRIIHKYEITEKKLNDIIAKRRY